MNSSTKNEPKPIRDIAYYQQRFRNRVFLKFVSFVTEQACAQHLTQKDIAERARKDPAVISRILSNPSNLTLDTISDVLLALDAEADPPEIVLFRDRPQANYMHPLMARALNVKPRPAASKAQLTDSGAKVFRPSSQTLKIEVAVSSGG
jgi:transcriptional regulator with XRE-family HTH domain